MASSHVSVFSPIRSLFQILRGPNPLLRGHEDLLSNIPGGRLFERSSFVDNSFHVLILVVFACHINPEYAVSPIIGAMRQSEVIRLSVFAHFRDCPALDLL